MLFIIWEVQIPVNNHPWRAGNYIFYELTDADGTVPHRSVFTRLGIQRAKEDVPFVGSPRHGNSRWLKCG